MKPLIYTVTLTSSKAREQERLLQSLKSSLDSIHLEYANSIFSDYDLVQFLMPNDLKKINDAKRAGRHVVACALYCETEKKTAMLERHGNKQVLKAKYRKNLNLADLVLVPGTRAKKLLEEQGVITRIEIWPTPIDLNLYDLKNKYEKDLFIRYYNVKRKVPYILCIGDYSNKNEMANLIEVAELCPFAKFYFLGANYGLFDGSKYIKNGPKNVFCTSLVDDDIYRSALVNAKLLLVLTPYKIEAINVLEAMAARTQIVAISNNKNSDSFLKDGENAYIRNGITELIDCIHKLIHGKLKYTTSNAYKYVQKFDLVKSGERLKKLYSEILSSKEN